MLIPFKHIETILPQRRPMVMIDELIAFEESFAVTTFVIKSDNVLLKKGKVTEALLLENIAQTAAAHSGYKSYMDKKEPTVGFIVTIQEARFGILPLIDQKIYTTITIVNQIFDFTLINGYSKFEGEIVCTCEMRIFTKN